MSAQLTAQFEKEVFAEPLMPLSLLVVHKDLAICSKAHRTYERLIQERESISSSRALDASSVILPIAPSLNA